MVKPKEFYDQQREFFYQILRKRDSRLSDAIETGEFEISEASEAQFEEWDMFVKEFVIEGNDRASVVLAGSYLDEKLRELLIENLVDDMEEVEELVGDENGRGNPPLGTFSARIQACYCLQLIDRSLKRDLDYIRRIRNRFAHGRPGLSFDDQQIADWSKNLSISQKFSELIADIPRARFIITAGVAALLLKAARESIRTDPFSHPPEP